MVKFKASLNLYAPSFIALVLSVFFLSTSCQKDVSGCMDPLAENFNVLANKDDGSCSFAKEKFIGSYDVTQTCIYEGDTSYQVTISDGPTKDEIVIENFFNYNVDIRASVLESTISFNETKLGIVFEGTGYLVNNKLTIDFEVCEAFYYPCSDPDLCTMTCIKK